MNNYFRLLLQTLKNVAKKNNLHCGKKLVHFGWSTNIVYSNILCKFLFKMYTWKIKIIK